MLKNILKIEGTQKLTTAQKQSLQGGFQGGWKPCTQNMGLCCERGFCDAGRCTSTGCFWY